MRQNLLIDALKRVLVAWLPVCLFACLPDANAQTYVGWTVPGGTWNYSVNTNRMASILNGPELTASQTDYEWYVAYAFNTWSSQSGGDIEASYDGRTSASCIFGSDWDDINTVSAEPTCATNGNANCRAWARVEWYGVGGSLDEADLCIFDGWGPNAPAQSWDWNVSSDLDSNDKDLLGTLVHEVGHIWGLDHTPDTVMDDAGFWYGSSAGRSLYATDIDGIRALYGGDPDTVWWSRYTASSESTTTPVGVSSLSSTEWRIGGSLARDSTGAWRVVRAMPVGGGSQVALSHAPYGFPSSSTTWMSRTFSTATFDAPAIAASDVGSGVTRTVMSIAPPTTDTTACSTLVFYASDDVFNGWLIYYGTISTACTLHAPALAYDGVSDRWIVAWVESRDSGSEGEIYMRTSTNGTTWSSATEIATGLHALESPSMACDELDGCILVFSSTDDDTPNVRNQRVVVGAGGIPIIANFNQDSTLAHLGLAGWSSGVGASWFLNLPLSLDMLASGTSYIMSNSDSSLPLPSSWNLQLLWSRSEFGSATHQDRLYGYVFGAN